MKKIIDKEFEEINNINTRFMFMNAFNYEVAAMMPEEFVETNAEIEENNLELSDIVKNDLNGTKYNND